MYTLVATSQFKKDLKRIKKRGLDIDKLRRILESLCRGEALAEHNRDHALTGRYIGFRECHIKPDWLLIYAIDGERLILTATRTGTHSDLFDE